MQTTAGQRSRGREKGKECGEERTPSGRSYNFMTKSLSSFQSGPSLAGARLPAAPGDRGDMPSPRDPGWSDTDRGGAPDEDPEERLVGIPTTERRSLSVVSLVDLPLRLSPPRPAPMDAATTHSLTHSLTHSCSFSGQNNHESEENNTRSH